MVVFSSCSAGWEQVQGKWRVGFLRVGVLPKDSSKGREGRGS